MLDADRPTHQHRRAVVAIAALLAASAATAQTPVQSVRNTAPEQAVAAESQQWSIYYPHLAHRLGAAASTDEILLRQLLDLHSAMRYDQATAVAVRIVELDPSKPESHYNLACVLARMHQTDAALGALDRAVASGWRDRDHLSIDPDLKIVRGDVRFGELVSQLESLVRLERETPTPEAASVDGTSPTHATDSARRAKSTTAPAPIVLLVAEPPEFPMEEESTERPAVRGNRIITMALTPAFARRLSAWLARHDAERADATADAPAPSSGWIISPGSDIRERAVQPTPARSVEPAAATAGRS